MRSCERDAQRCTVLDLATPPHRRGTTPSRSPATRLIVDSIDPCRHYHRQDLPYNIGGVGGGYVKRKEERGQNPASYSSLCHRLEEGGYKKRLGLAGPASARPTICCAGRQWAALSLSTHDSVPAFVYSDMHLIVDTRHFWRQTCLVAVGAR